MRIVHVIPTYVPAYRYGGPIRATHELARAQVRAGHEVRVLTTDRDGPGRLEVTCEEIHDLEGVAVSYHRCRIARLHLAPGMRPALREVLSGADLLHVHALFSWPTAVAPRVARRVGCPYVVSPRGMLVNELIARRGRIRKRAWLRLFERRNLEGADALVVASRREAEDAEAASGRWPPIAVVPHGVSAPPPTTWDREASAPAVPTVLFLGRLEEKKGLDLVLRALAGVPGLRLRLVGPEEGDHARELAAAARSYGVQGRVAIEPPLYDDARWRELAACTAMVLPSRHENFGNAVLEAMSVGTFVLVSDAVGAGEIVAREGCGEVLPRTVEAWRQALRALVRNPGAARRRGERGRQACRDRYTWDAAQVALEEVYERARSRFASRRKSASKCR
jgi:glycosyltransferase involved in cell wall biosynthesis